MIRTAAASAAVLVLAVALPAGAQRTLTHVSYDVTRELYEAVNPGFAAAWRARTGESVEIRQSHGGSSKQARAVIDGLDADVVTMNQALDIDSIARAGRLAPDWAARLPNGGAPFWSTIVFVVRAGNPKAIRDWGDLVRPGVQVVMPNPKTSGNGRYGYLAAWAWASRTRGGEPGARAYVRELLIRIPVFDTGGRAATTTFVERGIGDVLLTFENEVGLIEKELGADRFETVTPSLSIRAPLPVSWVDAVVERRGTADLARAYVEHLYTPEVQEVAARLSYRPTAPAVAARHAGRFPALELVSVEEVAGSWSEAQRLHFADGGIFDQLSSAR